MEGLLRFILSLFIFFLCACNYSKKDNTFIRNGHANVISFNKDWKFIRYGYQSDGKYINEPKGLYDINYDDSKWIELDVPHDFAITGPFRIDLAGNTGRLPYQGIGWYRKKFFVDSIDVDKRFYIDFDGVMAYAEVWLNGNYIGTWPYGYNSFRFDLTPYINFNKENVIAVRTDTEKWDSRWYPGAGIYRNVWLIKTGGVHVKHWGTKIETTNFKENSVDIVLLLELENNLHLSKNVSIKTDVHELDKTDCIRDIVFSFEECSVNILPDSIKKIRLKKNLKDFKYWDINTPNRYLACTKIIVDGKELDRYYTSFGIRKIEVSRKGFYLNGKRIKINGVCMHHDLGALGTAVNVSAIERQLDIMQNMGCNSIRTSHNPPTPELLYLADKKGIIIMDEAFDAWEKGKRDWDYNKLYKEWHEKDLEAMVRRDWNHPSVIFWSIGNEVMEQRNRHITKHLVDIVKRLDKTRPVTNGYNDPDGGRASGACLELDIMGVNYFFEEQNKWDKDKRYKDKPTIGTETSSCVSSRGIYFLGDTLRKNFQITSYDLDSPKWGCMPDSQFVINYNYSHLLGEYVWTGFDYLGEPTPFNSDKTNLLNFRTDPHKEKELLNQLAILEKQQPPSRSSYFGIVDLAGFPKDRYYLYQSQWRPDLPMVHILPHWNWPDKIGQKIPVHVYTSGKEAELFVNGKSYGRKSKIEGKDFRLVWDNVDYHPGTLKVVAYKDGRKWSENEIVTSDKAYKIILTSDKKIIDSKKNELAFVKITIKDKNDNIVPTACVPLKIKVSGNGKLVAVDNGDPTSFTSFQSDSIDSFNGLALAIIKSCNGKNKNIIVEVSSCDLYTGKIDIKVN